MQLQSYRLQLPRDKQILLKCQAGSYPSRKTISSSGNCDLKLLQKSELTFPPEKQSEPGKRCYF